MSLAGFHDNRFIKRLMLQSVALANEDSQQHGVSGDLHDSSYGLVIKAIVKYPSQTAKRQRAKEAIEFVTA